jgi:TonB family protein
MGDFREVGFAEITALFPITPFFMSNGTIYTFERLLYPHVRRAMISDYMNRIGICCCLAFLLWTIGCRGSHRAKESSEPNYTSLKSNPIVRGTILHKVEPVYPPVARAAHVEGTVTLHAIISSDGTVESLEAIDGPMMLRGAAVDAVKQWVYAPYTLNGLPRRVDTTVTVNFRLTRDSSKGGSR